MIDMVIRNVEPSEWDDILTKNSHSPYLSSKYLEPISNKRLKPIFLVLMDDENIIGGISGISEYSNNYIVRTMNLFKSVTFLSAPFLLEDKKNMEFWKELIEYLKKQGYCKFKMMQYDSIIKPDIQEIGFRFYKYDQYVIYLKDDWPIIKRKFNKGIRNNLNRAKRAELRFHISNDPKLLKDLFQLNDETAESRRKRGYSIFYRNLIPHLDNRVMRGQLENNIAYFGYLELDDMIISIQYFIRSGDRAYGILSGNNELGYKIGANAYNIYCIMEHLWKTGCKIYNLGGSTKEGMEGLIRFKKGLGAVEVQTWSVFSPLFIKGLPRSLYNTYRKIGKFIILSRINKDENNINNPTFRTK